MKRRIRAVHPTLIRNLAHQSLHFRLTMELARLPFAPRLPRWRVNRQGCLVGSRLYKFPELTHNLLIYHLLNY
jgi:hypothetical protein